MEWISVQARLESNTDKLWSLHEMEITAVNRMLLVMIKIRVRIYFMIVQQKLRKAEEVCVTMLKHWNQERKISQEIAL